MSTEILMQCRSVRCGAAASENSKRRVDQEPTFLFEGPAKALHTVG